MTVVALKNINKEYLLGGSTVTALKDVNLNIEESGQLLVIMGPSGSGKSTLLNLLGGIDSPSSGEVNISGQSLQNMENDDLADFRSRNVGFIFQNFNLITSFTALENVMLAFQISALEFDFDPVERAKMLLTSVGLGEHMTKRANQLSGGQMQRVAIARALMNDPDIVLADEPTANLDQVTGESVIKLLKDLSSRMNKLVIIATHDPLVESYGDRKINVGSGQIVGDS